MAIRSGIIVFGLSLAISLRAAHADTFPVTNTTDIGAGSLRQAILDANAKSGTDTISFAIPNSDPNRNATTGVFTIAPASVLPTITSPVVIDGYTQPGASPNTLAEGNNAVLLIEINGTAAAGGGIGFSISAASTVRGLVINRFPESGIQLNVGGNVIEGNFIGTDVAGTSGLGNLTGIFFFRSANNQIGGTSRAARNLISGNRNAGIETFTSSNNVIEGNFFGTDASGTVSISTGTTNNPSTAIKLGAVSDNNRIGGTSPGARNVISGDQGAIIMQGTVGNVVEGNYIGTDVTGNAVLGIGNGANQQPCAVCVTGNRNPLGSGGGPGTDNRIGGTAPGAGNVIAGYTGGGAAIFLGGTSSGDSRIANSNIVQGNFIGTNKNGTIALGNLGNGVHVQDGSDNLIGGIVPGAPNTIANGTNGSGVVVSAGTRNRILGNSIYGNQKLGIDLGFGTAGVTVNDIGDADTGPNNLQNFPVLQSVTNTGGNVNITGTLNSAASTTFRLEFFRNDAIDPTGFGEGQVFLGSMDVLTDASGNAIFNANFPSVAVAQRVTATATDLSGSTSEFSAALGQLLNISTRLKVDIGDNVLIGGFIITGTDPKKVIIRGIGPSLSGTVQGFLADPTLELHQGGTTLATNDNWKTRSDGSSQQAEVEATTIPPTNDLESAIVATLPANGAGYTAIVRGKNNTTGIGVVEAYDLDQTANSRLANISTRGFVETGNNVLIGGFIAGNGVTKVIVRAIGPTLTSAGVTNPLADPTLELHNGNGATIRSNDNWKIREDGSSQQTEIEMTTIPPQSDSESALVQTLFPGNYTAIVRGVNSTIGTAVVEVYALQ